MHYILFYILTVFGFFFATVGRIMLPTQTFTLYEGIGFFLLVIGVLMLGVATSTAFDYIKEM